MWDSIKRHSDQCIPCVLGLASLILYVATLAPSVLVADGGEFQFAAPLAGIAHPTGYPLYLILGWLWTNLLPFGSPALAMNSSSLQWLLRQTVAMLYLTVRRTLKLAGYRHRSWLARGISALSATTLAVSHTFWSQAVITEVYALNTFFVVWIIYVLLGWVEHGLVWQDSDPPRSGSGIGAVPSPHGGAAGAGARFYGVDRRAEDAPTQVLLETHFDLAGTDGSASLALPVCSAARVPLTLFDDTPDCFGTARVVQQHLEGLHRTCAGLSLRWRDSPVIIGRRRASRWPSICCGSSLVWWASG